MNLSDLEIKKFEMDANLIAFRLQPFLLSLEKGNVDSQICIHFSEITESIINNDFIQQHKEDLR
jgi:hypothetical protein